MDTVITIYLQDYFLILENKQIVVNDGDMSADLDYFPALLVLHNWKNCFAYLIDEVQLATIIHHGNAVNEYLL